MKDTENNYLRLVTKDGNQLLYNPDGTQLKGISKTIVEQDVKLSREGLCKVTATFPIVVIADENFKTVD